MSTPTASKAVAEEGEALPQPVKGKGRLVVVAGLGLLVLTGGGAGAWWLFLRAPREDAAAHKPKVVEPVRVTVPLGPVVVNLNGEARRYLRVAASLGVAGPKEAKEVEERKPQLLDLLISVSSSAEVDVLTSEKGRTGLKETLLGRIHGDLGLSHVARVYFTEFVIQ